MITLIESLKQVKDFREPKGIRHPLWLVLLLIIMATMSGYIGNRAIGDFIKRHEKEIITSFNLSKSRIPSYATVRRVLMAIDGEYLEKVFNKWAAKYANNNQLEWVAGDGKALKNTVTNYDNKSQNFASLVSFFSHTKGIVVAQKKFNNRAVSEIKIVQELLENLDLTNKVITLDAVHCQTETVKKIASKGGNYVMPVKKNQPLLLKAALNITEKYKPQSVHIEKEKVKDRQTTRIVSVFPYNLGIDKKWQTVKTVIKVERIGVRGNKNYKQVVYYISSLNLQAEKFAAGIRGHWGIENRLHYPKDVVFKEDDSPITQIQAATNLSILTTVAINLLRNKGHSSLTKAIRQIGNNWKYLCSLVV